MKSLFTNILGLFLVGSVVLLTSCNETDPLPISVSGFEVQDMNDLEKHIPVKFINLSRNADSYVWDFGDGTYDSTSISPEHIYTFADTYLVTLTSITKDGQMSSESKEIEVKTRVLAAFTVNNIKFVDENGDPWDQDDTGPDLAFYFAAQSATSPDDIILTDTIQDLKPENLPLVWEFPSGGGMELKNELYDLFLIDDDPEKAEDPKFDILLGIEFNPVLYEFTGKLDENTGYLQISTADGFAIDLYVSFELQ